MRLSTVCCWSVAAVAAATSTASAIPVPAYTFADGTVLDVRQVVGTGPSSAYLAVLFTDGTSEAFQYNFTGSLDGYTMAKAIDAATSLAVDDTFFASFNAHLVNYLTDAGGRTTMQYPALYYTPPNPGDVDTGASSQGVTFQSSQVGIDAVAVTDGRLLAFTNSYSAVPTLPSTAVPEPAAVAAVALGVIGLVARRRRRA